MPRPALARALEHVRTAAGRPAPVSDDILLTRFAADRDEAAFAELVRRHGPLVRGVARRRLADTHEADDVAQATFLELARHAHRLAGRPLAGWLFTVAYRLANKARIKSARVVRPPTDIATNADPLDALTARELVTALDEELARLPERYRLPLVLCALQGLSRDEAAARLGWTLGSLRGRLERGRELLRKRLTARGLTVPAVFAGSILASPAEAVSPSFVRTVARAAMAVSPAAVPIKAVFGAAIFAALTVGGGAALLMSDRTEAKAASSSSTPVALAPGATAQPRVDAEGLPLPPEALARLGSSRMRHPEMIRAIALSGDDKLVASADRAGGLRVWDAATGAIVQRRDFRTEDDRSVTLIAVGFDAGSRDVHCVTFGKRATVCSLGAAAGRGLRQIELRGGGKYLDRAIFASSGRLVAAAWGDKVLRLFETSTGRELWKLAIAGTRVVGMAFSADDRVLAVADCRDTIGLYDVANGTPVGELKDDGQSFALISLSADGRSALTLARRGQGGPELQFWDLPARKVRKHISPQALGYPQFVEFSPDSRLAVTGSPTGPCILWDVETAGEVRRLHGFVGGLVAQFSADGRTLAVGSNSGTVTLWDIDSGKPRSTSADPPVAVGQMRFTADRRQLIGLAGQPVAWDVETGRRLDRFAALPFFRWGAALSPDNRILAVPAEPARLYDTATGRELREIRMAKTFPSSIMIFTGDGRRLVCDTNRGPIHVFDVASGANVASLAANSVPGRFVLSPDGRWLAIDHGLPGNSGVALWDLSAGREVRKVPTTGELTNGLAFSNNGEFLAIASRPEKQVGDRNALQLWEVTTGRKVGTGEVNAAWGGAGLAFSPDDRMVAVGGGDGTVRLWEIASGSERHGFAGHVGYIGSVAFSNDGHFLASSSLEAPVYVWDVYGRFTARPPQSAKELEQRWDALMASDAKSAFRAIRRLINAPDAAVPLLRDRLKPAAAVDAERVKALITRLDSPIFADRQAAAKELDAVADGAADQLRAALAETKSAEVRRALQSILDRLDAGTPETLRALLRAVEVLEHIATPAARDLLKSLAAGAPGATLTRAAADALRRLASEPRN